MGSDSDKHLDESLFSSQFSSKINLTHMQEFMHRKCAGSMSAVLTQQALFLLVCMCATVAVHIVPYMRPHASVCAFVYECVYTCTSAQEPGELLGECGDFVMDSLYVCVCDSTLTLCI